MKTILYLVCLVLAVFSPAHAQDTSSTTETQTVAAIPAPVEQAPAAMTSEKRALIMKFIDVFGTRRTMEQNLNAMFEDMGPNDPQAKKFKENVRVNEIIEQLVPLYDKNFNEEDLKAFITFYSSPAGKKLLDTIPILMRDSVDISAKYFEEKFPAEKMEADKAEAPVEPVSSNTTTP